MTHSHPHTHPHIVDRRTLLRNGTMGLGALLMAACRTSDSDSVITATTVDGSTRREGATTMATTEPLTAGDGLPGFDAFADTVNAFTSGDVWMIESNGLPAHQMMVGITNWQQQFPVAQPYTGSNAWQFPRTPSIAEEPISARTGLFRRAIALAVNGIPIFNALNNRGDDAFLVGELDEFGGHCGRADDYHYHVAPLHLQDAVGTGNPIAYALDGFAIYGSTEPDGSELEPLDEYNGHVGADGVYHYHGTSTYPYLNGGMVGVVTVSDQIEPQPTTSAFRPAGDPLPGAVITAFEDLGGGAYRLEYEVDDLVGTAEYTVSDNEVVFEFTSPTGGVTTETYVRN